MPSPRVRAACPGALIFAAGPLTAPVSAQSGISVKPATKKTNPALDDFGTRLSLIRPSMDFLR
ncbi:MAG: hypothetical protein O7F08_13385 [Deltaproteobacteria bacterium]|nr:hypothetical protein [Deltaproteobacteria bacterium]